MRRSNARAPSCESNSNDMDAPRVPVRPVSSRSNLFSRNTKHAAARSYLLIFAAIGITVAVLCFFLALARSNRSAVKHKFGIVIDGGSTGTRIHVFEYLVDGRALVFDFKKDALWSMSVNPGLSAFAEDPDGAGRSLVDLLEFGKSKVPKLHWGSTEIRLMATAGLRLLDLGVQENILDSCRMVLKFSGFKFRDNWASVIKGHDEGIYAWVVANYALGTLGGDPEQTTGIIELGGASAQVTFVSSDPLPPEYSHALRFGNITYNLYSHSFLHFGQSVAFESLQESLVREVKLSTATEDMPVDPCTPKGYLHDLDFMAERKPNFTLRATGNFLECRSAALTFLQKGKDKCPYQNCYLGPTFTPKLRGKFLATENFFHTSKFLGLTTMGSLSDLRTAGQQFCEADWSILKKRHYSFDDDVLVQYCFSSAYIVALLHDSLGIGLDDARLAFASQVGDIPLDWAFGAFILQSMAAVENPHWMSSIMRDDSPTLLSLVFVCIIVMLTAWSVLKWKKPQVKTIYDLEKGRYIITRVNRS